jgi:hypothetical protein
LIIKEWVQTRSFVLCLRLKNEYAKGERVWANL